MAGRQGQRRGEWQQPPLHRERAFPREPDLNPGAVQVNSPLGWGLRASLPDGCPAAPGRGPRSENGSCGGQWFPSLLSATHSAPCTVPSAVKCGLVTVALPSCLGVLCDRGGEGPVKAPCKGQGGVNVRDYCRADFSASLLPAVCSGSRPTSPSILLGLQAWAASHGHQPGLNKSWDMSRQEMTVPGHPTESVAEQARNTPFCDKFTRYQAEFHLLPHGPPGQEVRPEVKDRGPQQSPSQASGRVARRPHFDPTAVPTAGSHSDISDMSRSVHGRPEQIAP